MRATPSGSRPGVIVMAKEPLPGRVKTRLCPPLSPQDAAEVAAAGLHDTLVAAKAATTVTGSWVTVALDGSPGPWLPAGIGVIAQRGRALDERLANAFADVGTPAVAIAGDTPQLTAGLLVDCLDALGQEGTDAILGPAHDGGYWVIGLRRPDPRVFLGVPMSQASTAQAQLDRLAGLGLRVVELPSLRDVDTFDDAVAVAAEAPESRFALALAATSAMAGRV